MRRHRRAIPPGWKELEALTGASCTTGSCHEHPSLTHQVPAGESSCSGSSSNSKSQDNSSYNNCSSSNSTATRSSSSTNNQVSSSDCLSDNNSSSTSTASSSSTPPRLLHPLASLGQQQAGGVQRHSCSTGRKINDEEGSSNDEKVSSHIQMSACSDSHIMIGPCVRCETSGANRDPLMVADISACSHSEGGIANLKGEGTTIKSTVASSGDTLETLTEYPPSKSPLMSPSSEPEVTDHQDGKSKCGTSSSTSSLRRMTAGLKGSVRATTDIMARIAAWQRVNSSPGHASGHCNNDQLRVDAGFPKLPLHRHTRSHSHSLQLEIRGVDSSPPVAASGRSERLNVATHHLPTASRAKVASARVPRAVTSTSDGRHLMSIPCTLSEGRAAGSLLVSDQLQGRSLLETNSSGAPGRSPNLIGGLLGAASELRSVSHRRTRSGDPESGRRVASTPAFPFSRSTSILTSRQQPAEGAASRKQGHNAPHRTGKRHGWDNFFSDSGSGNTAVHHHESFGKLLPNADGKRDLHLFGPVTGRPYSERMGDQYVMEGVIGRGQTGTVQQCRHRESGRAFACKTVYKAPFLAEDRLEDLKREVRWHARVFSGRRA